MGWGDSWNKSVYNRFKQLVVDPQVGTLTTKVQVWEGAKEVMQVAGYLDKVRAGVAGTPLCPFINAVHLGGGYWVKLYRFVDSKLVRDYTTPTTLDEVAADLKKAFWQDPNNHGERKVLDFKTLDIDFLIIAFPQGDGPEFYQMLDEARDRLRLGFLEEGLMLSQMHRGHPDPTKTGGFVSEIPLLCCRRMHKQDVVFMTTPEALTGYYKFFPPE